VAPRASRSRASCQASRARGCCRRRAGLM
jgi:hypothetical protein